MAPTLTPTATRRRRQRHRVVIIGAGFGGLAAAKALRHVPVDVTIIDARNHHTFQPLLYQVATAGLDADDVCYAVRGVFHRQRNVTVTLGAVTDVDLDTTTLTLDDGRTVTYDTLIVAPGAVSNSFGIPGVDTHAFGLKSINDALSIRSHILRCFETADGHPALVDDGLLNVVVAGGGPTGVELAGGLSELFDRVLRHDFPQVPVTKARVVLVEAGPRLLPTFDPALSAKAQRTLERRRVEVLVNTPITEVTADAVDLADGTTIATRTVVWAAGVKANPLTQTLGADTDRNGRLVVNDDLTLPNHPNVFVIGDAAASPGPDGRPLPQVAPVAMQGAAHAARMIGRQLHGQDTEAFRYLDKGSMATIGRMSAVAELPGGTKLSGPIGWVAWLALHLVMLIGFRNRLNVLTNWAWNYLTYDRASRIITEDDHPALRH